MGVEQEQPGATNATGGLVGRSIDEFVNQLRGFTDRARSIAGTVPSKLSLPALPSPPGAMSAAQLRSVQKTIGAQRKSLAAMRAQIDAFDHQLAVFERLIDPLVEWSASWSQLEAAVGDFVHTGSSDAGKPYS